MTNWENKGEGKQDKVLVLAVTYFFCRLLQPCWSRARAAPQGAATADCPDNRGTKARHSDHPLSGCMEQDASTEGPEKTQCVLGKISPC